MSTFLRAHWKAIVAIVLLVLLATVTANPRAMPSDPAPAARLRTHVAALASGQPADAGTYIEHALRAAGYTVRYRIDGSGNGSQGLHRLEAMVANVAPGTRPLRTFIVGAHYYNMPDAAAGMLAPADADDNASGAAAVLELAYLMKDVRPSAGTEVRFVFFLDPHAAPPADAAEDAVAAPGDTENRSFVAYVGTLASSRQVQDALAAFQGVAHLPPRGLAAPAYMQGVTLADRATWPQPGAATLVMTDTAFMRFPYRHADGADASPDAPPDEHVYASMARVVGALARTLTVLAAGQQG